jgi:hypothetical protein
VDDAVRKQMQMELLMTLLTTLLFLGMYWWSTLPEWKRQGLVMELRSHFPPRVSGGLSLADRLQIEQFRQEISRWEHASKRNNRMETRNPTEEGN